MPIPGYSIERIAAILAEPKVIDSDVGWAPIGARYRLETTSRIEVSGLELRITGNFNGRRWSFSLMLGNRQIFRWCTTRGHTNPDGEEITGPHIHSFDPMHRDFRAFQPPGFASTTVNEDFRSFLAECNITLNGIYGDVS